jgi:hypothetical protein
MSNLAGMETVTVPTPEQIKEAFAKKTGNGIHPRIMLDEIGFDRIRELSKTDPYMMEAYDNVYNNAVCLLEEPFLLYKLAEKDQLLETSRAVKRNIELLAMAYQISGEERFAERGYGELANAATFPNWCPEHFLDIAEMAYAFAIGYDWLFNYLSNEQRAVLVNAIQKHAINQALPFILDGKGWWIEGTSNWTTVCNGGISVAVLAIFEENPDMYAELISKSIGYVPKAIVEVAPNGCYPEGPGYWAYGTSYIVFHLSALESVLGSTYGLDEIVGLKETGGFPLYISGNGGGVFDFADSTSGKLGGPQTFWFAKHYNIPIYSWYQMNAYPIGSSLDMVWYDSEFVKTPKEVNLPLDIKYDGAESLVTFRGSFEDETSFFAGLKAGDNQSGHGDLDIGTFVFDALGVRWAYELSPEDYTAPGYWDLHQNAKRWNYYGKRAEGHNTIVINPDGKPDQNVYAVDKIIEYKTDKNQTFAVVDMCEAYKGKAKSIMRGMKLFENRTKLLVQDEIVCEQKSEIYWFMHTDASIDISCDGKIATLAKGSKQVIAVLTSPTDAVFQIMDASPLPQSPKPQQNVDRSKYKKLTIHIENVVNITINVTFIPLYSEEKLFNEIPLIIPIKDW